MQPIRLNHLPNEMLHLIAQQLDFNDCRNFRLSCKDIYSYADIKKVHDEFAQKAFDAHALFQMPTSEQLCMGWTREITRTAGCVVGGLGVFSGLAMMMAGGLCAKSTILIGAGLSIVCLSPLPLFVVIDPCNLQERSKKVKVNEEDLKSLLPNNSGYGYVRLERSEHSLEVDGENELSPLKKEGKFEEMNSPGNS